MAQPNGRLLANLSDTDTSFRAPDTSREPISIPAVAGAAGVSLASQSGAQPGNSMAVTQNVTTEGPTTLTGTGVATATAVPAKKSRSTFSYSRKKLTGKKTLWLYSQYEDQYIGPDLELDAVIIECPFKSGKKDNGDRYRLDWQKLQALPEGVEVAMLREWVANTEENKKVLREAIDVYEANHEASKKRKHNDPVTPRGPQSPPENVTYVARADAMTASTMSSLSTYGSVNSRRAYRTDDADHSDPDDDPQARLPGLFRASRSDPVGGMSDSDDDDCDLDEDDNAYSYINDPAYADETRESELETPDLSAKAQGQMGEYLRGLFWKFEQVTTNATIRPRHRPYSGPAGLKPGVSRRFCDPFECFSECGGLTAEFVARLAANSNDYFETHIKPGLGRAQKYHGNSWKPITIEDMYHFLGICLKISLASVDGGGYAAYFQAEDKLLYTGTGRLTRKLTIARSKGWAQDIMPLWRYKQIRGAFHPENKVASLNKDKCYQLRHAIQQFNSAALLTFVPSENLTFDEGGIACRSRMCPVRQYNKDKPDKYRVDFFVLSDAHKYFIYHLDVYQGKNDSNAYVDKRAADLPTTQKAVLNAVYKTGLDTASPLGYRHLSLDNRYQCPELAAILRDYCHIYSTGTLRKNRKGWDKELMNMMKTGERGEYVLCFCHTNDVIIAQWRDSKVVNVCSSVLDLGIGECSRQIGSTKKTFSCPNVVRKYQQTMFGVDKGDQIRLHGGGFARKAHYKKWYKKSFFAVLDCMLLNSLIAWNLAVEREPGLYRQKFNRHDFYAWIAETFMTYFDPNARSPEQTLQATRGLVDERGAHRAVSVPTNSRCVVCKLDSNYSRDVDGVKCAVSGCSVCPLVAHFLPLEHRRKIHDIEEFKDMRTCFEIVHSDIGREIWKERSVPEGGWKPGDKKYSVMTNHPIVQQLRVAYGYTAKKCRKDDC